MKAVCCLAIVAALVAVAAGTRLESVTKGTANEYYTIDLDGIFTDFRAFAGNADLPQTNIRSWGQPLPPTEAVPASQRMINLNWIAPGTSLPQATYDQLIAANQLTFTFSENEDLPAALEVKLEAPYLEIGPDGLNCGLVAGTEAERMDSCRCNPDAVTTQPVRAYITDAQKAFGTVAVVPGERQFTVTPGPELINYFEHAPYPGQSPFARTYRRLCYRTDAGAWIDSRIMVAVTQGCVDNLSDAGTTDPNEVLRCTRKGNNPLLTLVGALPTPLASDTDYRISRLGEFYVGVSTDINRNIDIATRIDEADVALYNGEEGFQRLDRLKRLTCCGASQAGVPGPFNLAATTTRFGACIDVEIASCCGRRAYNPTAERCCSRPFSTIRTQDQPCPCTIGTAVFEEQYYCQHQGSTTLGTVDDNAGLTQGATAVNFGCCATKLADRFPELYSTVINGITFVREQRSFCYDTTGPSDGFQCCNDGNVFDAGSQQCCMVTGVQSLNLPCPCGVNGDCPTDSLCCFQLFPPGLPRGQGASQCSAYANFPRIDNGAGVADVGDAIVTLAGIPQLQRCPGTCYNAQYQMCCNGAVCESGFTRCCNDTCCNKFSETCQLSQRSPLTSLSNSRDVGVYFEMCSRIELLSGRKAFFVFVLPAWLLLATAISLALVTVLARRATEHIFELTERAIVILAVFTVLLGCPFFFSPFYKNGIVIVLVGLVSILVSVARKRKASLFLVILLVLAIFYVINPFDGNIYLSITSAVPVNGARPESSLLEAAQNLWRTAENCVDFYDFFLYDPAHRDQRLHNPEDFTFGYCGRGYITALIIFAIALYVVLLLLLLLAVFSLVKKLGIKAVEPIELEVAMEPEFVY
jgi:hypothetical protein